MTMAGSEYGSVKLAHGGVAKGAAGDVDVSTPLLEASSVSLEEESRKPGYDSASWWSRLVFGWFGPLLVLANEKDQLDPEDLLLLPLPPDCRTDSVTSAFDERWEKEEARASAVDVIDDGTVHRNTQPSLMLALFRAFGRDFVRAGFLKLVHDLLIFVGPQVLNAMIYFLRDENAPLSRGILLTVVVTLSQLSMSFCLRHYFFRCYLVGLRVRTSVVVAVYRKALRLSSAERQTRNAGEITNLIAIDAQRLQELVTYLHAIWYSFLQIALALYFLWQQLGPSCLGGILVIIIMMPVTKTVAQWMGRMQKNLMKARDSRVELNNEVLGSMKVIKFQAWEESFEDRILGLRKNELQKLFRYIMGQTLSIMLWSAVPLLVALSTFATYTWLGNELEVASALTALALFEILRFPLFMLPQVINRFVEASVSLSRLRSFLLCEEHSPIPRGDLPGVGIKVENATFVYETKKPKFEEGSGGEISKDLYNTNWEVTLLRSQLADAENHIKELLKAEDESSGEEFCENHVDLSLPVTDTSPADLLSLRRINFESEGGEMIAVVGAVGAGKSSLFNALLGEIRQLSGTLAVRGRLALFAQTPFIMNDTLKANITFGHQGEVFDEKSYQDAISTCALKHDLKLLPSGDMTEIGEKGITLSGGQKARVAMARAVYHDADIYLLDDPLAAVDAHVGKYLFQRCIIDAMLLGKGSKRPKSSDGKAKKNTIILVTNALQYLSSPFVDRIMVFKDGCIQETGTYSELSSSDSSLFASFLSVLSETGANYQDESVPEVSITSVSSQSSLSAMADVTEEPEVARILSPKAKAHGIDSDAEFTTPEKQRHSPKSTTLMTDELKERETGQVNREVYLAWARAAGGTWVVLVIILAYGSVEAINVLSKWWLTYWSEHGGGEPGSQTRFLAIYACINLCAVVASFCRILLVQMSGLRASRSLFSRLLRNVLQAPMSFFDTTPTGRIVNRFSKDMYACDETLVSVLRSYLATLCVVLSTIIVISGVTPIFTFCLIPIIAFYLLQQNYFTTSYREIKRIDSVSRSPLYALLGETLDGVSTIRAFSAQSTLVERFVSMLDRQQNAYFLTFTAQCWLAVRLELAGTLIITFACLCAVLQHGTKGGNESFAGLAGLSISFSLSVTQALNWTVRMASDMEANMVAVERIEQYSRIKSEAPRESDADSSLIKKWPQNGAVDFFRVRLRYRPGLPLVLKDLNLHFPGKSKVGVVGRTGAGKSTLMVALLRIVELESGQIFIDGVDISTLGLATLRSKLAVIPQDPVLFSGSVRTNLDPFDEETDERLYEVLTRVGLYSPIERNLSSVSLSSMVSLRKSLGVQSLSDEVLDGGSNFSVGQKQLLVIARSLLRGARIVIMDEATAAVDADTDARIQRVMRTDFKDATCITVAHRLNTIMDSDYILVMDDGRAAEFDTPSTLLARGGLFKDLVDAWEEEKE